MRTRETKGNRSATSHQQELKAKHKLSEQQFQEMLEMLADLTAAERATLKDPEFISEDEADLIYSDRSVNGSGRSIPLDEVLKEFDIPPRRRRSA
jgi:hypothetical protein